MDGMGLPYRLQGWIWLNENWLCLCYSEEIMQLSIINEIIFHIYAFLSISWCIHNIENMIKASKIILNYLLINFFVSLCCVITVSVSVSAYKHNKLKIISKIFHTSWYPDGTWFCANPKLITIKMNNNIKWMTKSVENCNEIRLIKITYPFHFPPFAGELLRCVYMWGWH